MKLEVSKFLSEQVRKIGVWEKRTAPEDAEFSPEAIRELRNLCWRNIITLNFEHFFGTGEGNKVTNIHSHSSDLISPIVDDSGLIFRMKDPDELYDKVNADDKHVNLIGMIKPSGIININNDGYKLIINTPLSLFKEEIQYLRELSEKNPNILRTLKYYGVLGNTVVDDKKGERREPALKLYRAEYLLDPRFKRVSDFWNVPSKVIGLNSSRD